MVRGSAAASAAARPPLPIARLDIPGRVPGWWKWWTFRIEKARWLVDGAQQRRTTLKSYIPGSGSAEDARAALQQELTVYPRFGEQIYVFGKPAFSPPAPIDWYLESNICEYEAYPTGHHGPNVLQRSKSYEWRPEQAGDRPICMPPFDNIVIGRQLAPTSRRALSQSDAQERDPWRYSFSGTLLGIALGSVLAPTKEKRGGYIAVGFVGGGLAGGLLGELLDRAGS